MPSAVAGDTLGVRCTAPFSPPLPPPPPAHMPRSIFHLHQVEGLWHDDKPLRVVVDDEVDDVLKASRDSCRDMRAVMAAFSSMPS